MSLYLLSLIWLIEAFGGIEGYLVRKREKDKGCAYVSWRSNSLPPITPYSTVTIVFFSHVLKATIQQFRDFKDL